MTMLPSLGRSGATAVEAAMMLPVLALLFAGTADIGAVLIKRIQLNNSLSAAANYALVNQSRVTSANAGALATSLTAIVSGVGSGSYADSIVVVNNGPGRQTTGGIVGAASGTASNADRCYCPTMATRVSWGATVDCGTACTGGGGLRAGKFVELIASRAHRPLFANYGIVRAGAISVHALVQTG